MKQTTNEIKKVIVSHVYQLEALGADFDNTALNASCWKRHSKMKLKAALSSYTDDGMVESLGPELMQVFEPTIQITDDCIARYFVHPELSIEATVITEPSDEIILAIGWCFH